MANNSRNQAVIDLVINGQAAQASFREIQRAAYEAEKTFRNMTRAADPAAYERQRQVVLQLRDATASVNNELRTQGGILRETRSGWQSFSASVGDIMAGVTAANIATKAIEKTVQLLSQAPAKIAEIADEMTNVAKTTGLADDQVQLLFDGFLEMDTRSSRKELAELGEIAGKLGESTLEGAAEFVKGADIIKVALAKDLGGNSEAAVTKIAKIIEIFNLKSEFGIQQSFLKVGSAINSLGAASSASEEYIVNFTTRMAGIAPNAKIAVPDVLGLAAAMDQLGQSPELAATNIGKMLLALGKDVPYFAKVAGLSVKEFSSLLKTDANEAFLKVIERAQQSGAGLEGLAKTFTTLGIEGSEGTAVIGALAGKVDLVRESQRLSNIEFEAGTSVVNEYNKANNNSAAILDKINNKIENMWMTAKENSGPLFRFFGNFFGVINQNADAVNNLQTELGDLSKKDATLNPLIKKYNELNAQAEHGRDVNDELKTVIDKIAKLMPEAVTQVDAYGNAIDISTGKVKEMLKYQRELYELNKKSTVQSLESQYNSVRKEFDRSKTQFNSGQIVDNSLVGSFLGAFKRDAKGNLPTRPMTNKEREQELKRLAKLEAEQETLRAQLNEVYNPKKNPASGTPSTPANTAPKGKDSPFSGAGSSKKEAKEKKDIDPFREFNEQLRKLREENLIDVRNKNEREEQSIVFKYARLRELAKGDAVRIQQVNAAELEALNIHWAQVETSSVEASRKRAESEAAAAEELARKRLDIQLQIDQFTQTEQEKQVTSLNNQFDNLIANAEKLGLDTLPIWEAFWAARANLEDQFFARGLDKEKKAADESLKIKQAQLQSLGGLFGELGNIYGSFIEIAASNEAEYKDFQKSAAVVQIVLDTAMGISRAVSAGMAIGITPIEKAVAIASGIAVVFAGIAKAKAALSQAEDVEKPKVQRMPGRESGGATDLLSLSMDNSGNPAGYIRKPTLFNLGARSWIGGEGNKMEYVFSNAMLQNPIMANFAAMSEALRTSGYDFTRRADLQPTETRNPQGADPALLSAVAMLVEENKATRQAVQAFAKKPWNYRRVEETAELLDYIRTETGA